MCLDQPTPPALTRVIIETGKKEFSLGSSNSFSPG